MMGRLFEDDRDGFRVAHDVDAIRTRFEKQPFWPGFRRARASVARNDSTALLIDLAAASSWTRWPAPGTCKYVVR